MEKFGICRWKWITGNLDERHPDKSRATNRSGFTSAPVAYTKSKVNGAVWVWMDDIEDPTVEPHLDGKFFIQLSKKAFLPGFARLTFSPGKLPKSGEVSARRSLSDQKASIAKDQAGRHFDGGAGLGRKIPGLMF